MAQIELGLRLRGFAVPVYRAEHNRADHNPHIQKTIDSNQVVLKDFDIKPAPCVHKVRAWPYRVVGKDRAGQRCGMAKSSIIESRSRTSRQCSKTDPQAPSPLAVQRQVRIGQPVISAGASTIPVAPPHEICLAHPIESAQSTFQPAATRALLRRANLGRIHLRAPPGIVAQP